MSFFDLLQSGYAALDNLAIVSSNAANVIDRNNNGIRTTRSAYEPLSHHFRNQRSERG